MSVILHVNAYNNFLVQNVRDFVVVLGQAPGNEASDNGCRAEGQYMVDGRQPAQKCV